MTFENDEQIQSYIANLSRGQRITIRFTSRGTRTAEVVDATSRGVWIRTYNKKAEIHGGKLWSTPRKLRIEDFKFGA